MGTGRGRARLSWALLASVLALFAAGCGAEDHPNNPRPPVPVEVSVSIDDGRLSVQPSRIGFPDSDQPINQNEGQPQPELSSDRPLTVSFTVANLTEHDTELQFEGAASEVSDTIVGGSSGSFSLDLPSGNYFVVATDVPGTPETGFFVGPDRPSSQNDLLLP